MTDVRQNMSFYVKAFTLIEIILAMVLMGIMAGISIPAFSSTYHQMILRGKADDVAHVMRYAQSRAIADGRGYQVLIDEEASTVQLLEYHASSGQYEAYLGRWGRAVRIDPVTIDADQTVLSFAPDGRIDPVEIQFSFHDQHVLLTTKEHRGYVRVVRIDEE